MRTFWLGLGSIATLLGIIGIALPVVPTVPFFLVAAWAFAKSSPRLRQKILDHPTYGPSVRAWTERGAVSWIAKLWAICAMTAGVALAAWLTLPLWLISVQAAICAAVGAFLLTRPEP